MKIPDENTCAPNPPDFAKLDAINDDLHAIVRLMGRPIAVMSAPEVLDVVRMGLNDVMRRYHDIAFQMRANADRDGTGTMESATKE